MPRTVNVDVYRVRREAFLDAGQRLIQTKGYEPMSIQDVLDALDTSRGAFYHYFDSKLDLLDGVVERIADQALTSIEPILADPNLPALRKLERAFASIARFKAERLDLILALIQVWYSDGNALVREKVRRLTADRLGPILSRVIRQGVEEGEIRVDSPDETARVLVYLMQGYQDLAVQQFKARQAGTIGYEAVKRAYTANNAAFERILGVPQGALQLMDEATLRYWFDADGGGIRT